MKQLIHLRRVAMCLALLLLGVVGGCGSSPDERLADLAQQSITEQRKQNDRMADQSQAVVEESHQLAETAKQLVEHDAEARRELIAAQQELTSQLNGQQSAIYTGHEQLEQDRREIAEQRHRDPIIAAVIQDFGLFIACLLPLVVAVFAIRQMQSQEPDHAAVAELLVHELTADEPRLLPGLMSQRHALPHDDAEEAQHALIAGDSPNESDPLF
jgi:DNA repair exonuclease SbcCD ATPase subunit